MSSEIIVAFDLYGTLLSTESVARKLAELFGEDAAPGIAKEWRTLQLEYTWRLTAMAKYESFYEVTKRALRHALSDAGRDVSDQQVRDLMQAYDSLSTFPDVQPALQALRSAQGITAVIFSNGTSQMVAKSVENSPDLSPFSSVFKQIISVEEVKKFKPAPQVYQHLAYNVGKAEKQMGDIWLVSSNPFDVVGARACGMQVAWVDRKGSGWSDYLADGEGGPTITVSNLEHVIEAVKKHAEKQGK